MNYSKSDQKSIEKAISFLVSNFNATGHNEKPVILHSLRIAFYLMKRGVKTDVIIASLLHDLIEDADVSIEKIKTEFGDNISSIVSAVSFNPKIEDYEEQYKETFARCIEQGFDALAIKTADIYDNSDYYSIAPDDLQTKLFQKAKYFLEIAKPIIGDSVVWKDLENKLNTLAN